MAEKPAAGKSAAAKTVVKIIKFGPYEWRILDQQKDKALIITEQSVAQRNGEYCAACVHFNGKIYDKGFTVKGVASGNACVRPALWLKL